MTAHAEQAGADGADGAGIAGWRERALVPTLVLAGLVVALISSLGAPLIPTIATDMGSSLSSAQWSLTATLLVGAVATPVVGRLGDGPGRRTLILVCLAAVVAGGVLSALAGQLSLLVAGRALQGLGLALVPLLMAAAREHVPAPASTGAIAALSVVVAIGIGVGYPLTGLIAEVGDVADAFWFGAIVAALTLALAAAVVPAPVRPAASGPARRLDVLGAVVIAAGLVALLLALEQGPDWGWGSARTLGLLAVAIVLLGLWWRHELRVADPLVDLRLVRNRGVLVADLGGAVIGVAMYLCISLCTQYVQLPADTGEGLGRSVFVAGLALVPLSAGSFLASRWLTPLRRRVGLRALISGGVALLGLGALLFVVTADELWQVCVTMGLVGVGLGWTFATMPALIVGAVPPGETGSATGFYQVSRYVGFAVGSGISVTLLQVFGDDGAPDRHAFRMGFLAAALISFATAAGTWAALRDGPAPRRTPGPTRSPGGGPSG
jgi:MFS family permease